MSAIITNPPSHVDNEWERQLTNLKQRLSNRIQQGFHSELKRYGLQRDLSQSLQAPAAKIPVSIRPLSESDIDILLPVNNELSPAEKQEISWRRGFHRVVPHGCYVAVDLRNNTPCYMQWLLGAKDNDLIARFKCFPRLEQNEALMEQAYTPPSHRGLGIMSAAMALIAERAADMNARHVLTFVEEKNIASLKGCWRAGFHPHLLHRRVQLGYGFIIFNNFSKLAEDDPRRTMTF